MLIITIGRATANYIDFQIYQFSISKQETMCETAIYHHVEFSGGFCFFLYFYTNRAQINCINGSNGTMLLFSFKSTWENENCLLMEELVDKRKVETKFYESMWENMKGNACSYAALQVGTRKKLLSVLLFCINFS